MSTIFFMCLDVRGAIQNTMRQRGKRTAFTHPDGRSMTKEEAVDRLMAELSNGRECLPMNKQCGDPCKNSDQCAGFDYKGGGCPGYECERSAT